MRAVAFGGLGGLGAGGLAALSVLACAGTTHVSAQDGGAGDGAPAPICAAGAKRCSAAGAPETCDPAGAAWQSGPPCPAGSSCALGRCTGPCDVVAADQSYVGCEYWAVTTINRQLGWMPQDPVSTAALSGAVGREGFPFGVAVTNPSSAAATVTTTGGALAAPRTDTVAAGQTRVITLPWVPDLVEAAAAGDTTQPLTGTRAVAGGAYHIVSSAPLVAYQFNPLTFTDQRRNGCAPDDPADVSCFSYTNDASLLLPANVLGRSYTVMSWPTFAFAGALQADESPGFATIVASSPGDTTVTIVPSGYASAAVNSTDLFRPGETVTRTLHQGDVFQLLAAGPGFSPEVQCNLEPLPDGALPLYVCKPDRRMDLTGTLVSASAPVSVFVGHDCAMIPYNVPSCDHLEEQLFPDETWGMRYVVSPTVPQLAPAEPTWVRVLSGKDGNVLTFTPPVADAPPTLDRGQYFDFLTFDGAVVEGTGALLVAQYFVGQDYNADGSRSRSADPSMVLEVPVEQWRASYDFYVPATYVTSYVNVVTARGGAVTLDGADIPAASQRLPLADYDVIRIDVSQSPGPHHLQSSDPFALQVYGFAPFTSYMYPGGLNLRPITVP